MKRNNLHDDLRANEQFVKAVLRTSDVVSYTMPYVQSSDTKDCCTFEGKRRGLTERFVASGPSYNVEMSPKLFTGLRNVSN